ncbi:hypothetical protein [Taibaiella chishuiensis]|uniref:DUF4197 domain-containing protein n=1 Tax=Taibaiella chishuiensis TaxID=1434707 RepID=A0A2P8D465_9BACT|nr:hypothetical protein [Taibaiella chishuiensis]PSK92005.1 hypothetical protein B0I18_10499 [Taibaiella chishuiensis]
MKQTIQLIAICCILFWANACDKPPATDHAGNAVLSSVMTVSVATIGKQHNTALGRYQTNYGFNTVPASLTKAQVETIINSANQVMIDLGILTGTTAAQQTADDMTMYTSLGFFDASDNLMSQEEIIIIMLGQIQNAAIKTAHVNMINYTGNDFGTYAMGQFNALLANATLSTSEKGMITGAKSIFSASLDFWNTLPAEAMNGGRQALMDEMGYMVGFIMAKANGQTDGMATVFGLYNGIRLSTMAGMM